MKFLMYFNLMMLFFVAKMCNCLKRVTFNPFSMHFRSSIPRTFPRRMLFKTMTQVRAPLIKVQKMSLIGSSDMWSIYAVISSAAVAGLACENTKVGKSLSGAVCSMLIGSALCNFGILPPNGSVHIKTLQLFVVKLATPLLLLGADLRKILQETGRLFQLFLLASLGTLAGALMGTLLLQNQLKSIDEVWRVLSAMTAKNIGGGINFVAVTELLHVPDTMSAAALAVDNILGLIYFPLVGWLARNEPMESPNIDCILMSQSSIKSEDTVQRDLQTITLGLIFVAISEKLAAYFKSNCGPLISTCLTVITATACSRRIKSLIPQGERIGKQLLFLFFASIGASSGKISSLILIKGVDSMVLFGLIMYAVHMGIVIGLGRAIFRGKLKDVLVVSNAAIGNSATASTFASGKGWHSLFVPALLIGSLGNSIGTILGVGLGSYVLKPLLQQ